MKSKQLAERNFLSRRVSRKVTGIIDSCPNIGEEIEKFVQDCSIGADAWRRTGVLTFDGNTKVNNKVTYERIRQHLMKIYNRNFSYGTVVQLCIARNKRRLSAKRYKGVANVTSRRARKGFMLRYNPDAHWSSAFYRNLNVIQYTDGRHIVNINRDDASGFVWIPWPHIGCIAHQWYKDQKPKPCTYTDYVPKYKAVIQTTSYNFSKTETTLELCAGVVKPVGVFLKNPTQHVQDLEMLEESVELRPAFINPLTNKQKLIECIRVDGAADEGPSHEEVQFIWTAHHIVKATQVTLVTARNSGSSYLNRVELQNGCLALAHANLFIPNLPPQYIFFLVCCYKPHCTHPLCSQQSSSSDLQRWYESGPLVSYLPLSIPDPNRSYGNHKCKECKDFCYGHFLKPEETIACTLQPMIKPPSVILKEAFDSCTTYPPCDSVYNELSEKVMLPVEEVKFWFNHLKNIQNNGISGAQKAAETRRKKKTLPSTLPISSVSSNEYQCGICHTPYQEFTEVEEDWIGCDLCESWYHFICVGIDNSAIPEQYICTECDDTN